MQSRDTLQVIVQAMQGEAIFERDETRRNELLGMAKLA